MAGWAGQERSGQGGGARDWRHQVRRTGYSPEPRPAPLTVQQVISFTGPPCGTHYSTPTATGGTKSVPTRLQFPPIKLWLATFESSKNSALSSRDSTRGAEARRNPSKVHRVNFPDSESKVHPINFRESESKVHPVNFPDWESKVHPVNFPDRDQKYTQLTLRIWVVQTWPNHHRIAD